MPCMAGAHEGSAAKAGGGVGHGPRTGPLSISSPPMAASPARTCHPGRGCIHACAVSRAPQPSRGRACARVEHARARGGRDAASDVDSAATVPLFFSMIPSSMHLSMLHASAEDATGKCQKGATPWRLHATRKAHGPHGRRQQQPSPGPRYM